jgi:glycosyltransferase involved in cell wall biosynthesis
MLVSHSYHEPEVRKNILALARYAEVRIVAPETSEVLVFDRMSVSASEVALSHFATYKRLGPSWAQYLLATPSMGLRGYRPDIIHVDYHPWQAIFLQTQLCRALFVPGASVVCTIKKNTYIHYSGLRSWLKGTLARASTRRVDHWLAASSMVAELYEKRFDIDRGAISVVPQLGVDTDLFTPLEDPPSEGRGSTIPEPLKVGYAGWLTTHKGVGDLVAAVDECRAGGLDLELRLLGGGALADTLSRRARDDPRLRVFPVVPNSEVAGFLRGLDIFVLPSRVLADHQEHDARALTEALAVGLPSIGTKSGIIPEILGDGTGLVVSPNSPSDIALAIQRLARDGMLRQRLASASRDKAVQEFSLDSAARQRIAMYADLLARRPTKTEP